jgi:hypothetical protein
MMLDEFVKSSSAALRCNLSHCGVQKVRLIPSILRAFHLILLRIRQFLGILRDHQA